MKTLSILIAFSFLLVIAGCQKNDQSVNRSISLTKSQKEMVSSSNTFGLNLFQSISKTDNSGENVFISPLSVSLALSMVYNGADGTTREAIQKTLGYAGLTIDDVNLSNKDLINALCNVDPKVIMEIANSIWYDQNQTVLKPFIDVNKEFYNAEVSKINFSQTSSLDLINGWVNEKTHGKIPAILDQIPSDAVMYLINAIYFKGTWMYEFDKTKTAKKDFTLANSTKVSTDFMVQKGTFPYLTNELFSAVELPYGGGNYSMVVMLPNDGKTEKDIINNLSDANWSNWISQVKSTGNVQISLPKFKLTYKSQLNSVLSSLGMGVAFDPINANFSKIDGFKDLYISKVLHKTYVEVNEEGTEAAAITSVEISVTSAGPGMDKTIYFNADKPFVFAIREKESNTILFMGILQNPL